MPATPISLYIDLEPGRTAELEVVARASLAFAAGLREAAFLLDPSFEFRIELERGDEGSLWLKAFIRWIRGLGHAHPTMMAVAASAGMWFMTETGVYTYEKLLDWLLKSKNPEIVRLAPDQIEDIARRAAAISGAPGPRDRFSDVYKQLELDPAIRGVGVAPEHDRIPEVIIPRSEFAFRATSFVPDVRNIERRVRSEHGDYVIIKPVLKEGGGKWRLRGPHGEFSATIEDDAFYHAILQGDTSVPLAADIHMTADVEVEEDFVDGAGWRPTKFRVRKVHSIRRRPSQPPLIAP